MILTRTVSLIVVLVMTQLLCLQAIGGVEAEVRDISGNKYFEAVHLAFQNAESSIYVAMYEIHVNPDRKSGPHYRLVQDLINALKRGVKVKVYLDRSVSIDQTTKEPIIHDGSSVAFDILRNAGVDVRYVVPSQRLHAKLIVVDERTVVDGSANWSYSALVENAESSTMIISQQYAVLKLQWIWALKVQKDSGKTDSAKTSAGDRTKNDKRD